MVYPIDKEQYLVHSAKNVCIVLLKAADAGQAGKRSGEFVTVQNTKISHTKWQLPPGTRPMIKHQTAGTKVNIWNTENT